MKKISILLLLWSEFLLAILPLPIFAEEISRVNTSGFLKLKKPEENDLLKIDYAPKSFVFQTNEIPIEDTTLYAVPNIKRNKSGGIIEEQPNYVQVTDKRATYTGWRLTVKQEKQFVNPVAKLNNELTGAIISLGTKEAPAKLIGIDISEQFKPAVIATQVKLTPKETSVIAQANTSEGFGTWRYCFGDKSPKEKAISIEIKGNGRYAAGNYVAILTWALTECP